MGFSKMATYSSSNLPSVGSCSSYTICDDIGSYKPYDIGDAAGQIESAFEELLEVVDTGVIKLWDIMGELEKAWGTDFIAINGHSPRIVDRDIMLGYTDQYPEKIYANQYDCTDLVKEIERKLEEVNEYINQIEKNNQKYKDLKKEKRSLELNYDSFQAQYNNATAQDPIDYATVSYLDGQMHELANKINLDAIEIQKYEAHKISEPDGSWVLN